MKKKELDDDKTFRDEMDNLASLQEALFQLVKSPAKTFSQSQNVSESKISKTKLVYAIGPNTNTKKRKRKGEEERTRRRKPFCFNPNNLKMLKSLIRRWMR